MEMNAYLIVFSEQAEQHIQYFKKLNDAAIQRKISRLLQELKEHPFDGSGQVEALKYDLAGMWSRRINREHRILYEVDDEKRIVYIYKLFGHY